MPRYDSFGGKLIGRSVWACSVAERRRCGGLTIPQFGQRQRDGMSVRWKRVELHAESSPVDCVSDADLDERYRI